MGSAAGFAARSRVTPAPMASTNSAIDGALTFLYFTVGVAYRFNRWSVGVTGNLIRSSIASTQAKSPVGFGDPDVTREGRAAIDVSTLTSAASGHGTW